MARYAATIESQVALGSGTPVSGAAGASNGLVGYWNAATAAGYRLRRVVLGVRAGASVPTSQQVTIGLYRQTVSPVGTGVGTAVAGQALEVWTPVDPTGGIVPITITGATTFGTTGSTVAANPLHKFTFNTQSGWDIPFELLEELVCNLGAANSLAFVNIGNVFPAAHLLTVSCEVEV